MTQLGWIGVLVMCAAMAYGKQDPYYLAVASADGLLLARTGEVVRVTLTASVQGQGGMQRHDFEINGTPLSVILTNGIIVGMVRDGKDLGIQPPELELDGNKEWVALSKHYHEEALRLLSFVAFLDVDELTEVWETSVVGVYVSENECRIVCERSGRTRRFCSLFSAELTSITDALNDARGTAFHVSFGKDMEWLAEVTGRGFFAKFFPHGGLKSLYQSAPETHEGLSERKWNEKGELIHERDLKKDPYPDFDWKDVRMLKGGREI